MNRVLLILAATVWLALSALAPAQDQAPPAEPIDLTVGHGERVFSTASARGSFLIIHIIPAATKEDTQDFLKTLAAQAATVAGVRHAVTIGGPADTFASVLAASPVEIQGILYYDADGNAARLLGIAKGCDSRRLDPCHTIVLLDPTGREARRVVGNLSEASAGFEAIVSRVTELTRNKQTTEANLGRGLALQGYDPVSYIDQQRAALGDKRYESIYRGVRYRFASAANRLAFNATPSKYLPAYGGWCATAMAKGDKVEVDPKNFKVTDGRLFLFYRGLLGNAINDWNAEERGLTVKADKEWGRLTADQ